MTTLRSPSGRSGTARFRAVRRVARCGCETIAPGGNPVRDLSIDGIRVELARRTAAQRRTGRHEPVNVHALNQALDAAVELADKRLFVKASSCWQRLRESRIIAGRGRWH